ncbi:VOC family protein [Phytoactinopolyspora limicola]|uniref:VOC family protein n=1 Tax=Phytoactinopolyspora limicola TaxID=2715536 RepID=UPI00140BE8AC|nr:VOC family protein [Phytoactinopolyspora limicola]
MPLQATTIMIGVSDLARAKQFYVNLGATVSQDYPGFVNLDLGKDSSSLALYPWGEVADDAGVPAEGSGFRGFSLHYIVDSPEAVEQAMRDAVAAGATVIKEATATDWGCFGYFSDPDGYLWKVASSA